MKPRLNEKQRPHTATRQTVLFLAFAKRIKCSCNAIRLDRNIPVLSPINELNRTLARWIIAQIILLLLYSMNTMNVIAKQLSEHKRIKHVRVTHLYIQLFAIHIAFKFTQSLYRCSVSCSFCVEVVLQRSRSWTIPQEQKNVNLNIHFVRSQ